MERYRGEASLPQANDSSACLNSPDYYVDGDGEADWDRMDVNLADELMDHAVLKTKFTKLQKARLRADVFAFSPMIGIDNFALGRVSAPVAGEVPSDNEFWRTVEVSE